MEVKLTGLLVIIHGIMNEAVKDDGEFFVRQFGHVKSFSPIIKGYKSSHEIFL